MARGLATVWLLLMCTGLTRPFKASSRSTALAWRNSRGSLSPEYTALDLDYGPGRFFNAP